MIDKLVENYNKETIEYIETDYSSKAKKYLMKGKKFD